MTVTAVRKDHSALTLTIDAEFDAPIERVWQLWADPRLLERWWGPPSYPATVIEHELVPGGRVVYYMTGPERDRHFGWWVIESVDAPHRLRFEDGFADDDGTPLPGTPTMVVDITHEEVDPGQTRTTIVTTFPTLEAMEQVLEMGAEEGMKQAMAQIDPLLEVLAARS